MKDHDKIARKETIYSTIFKTGIYNRTEKKVTTEIRARVSGVSRLGLHKAS